MKLKTAPITQKLVFPKSRPRHPHYFFKSLLALVVDDSKAVRIALKSVLERKLKLKVYLASNGVEGIRQVMDHAFDLIISDVEMPVMDGMTFYDWLDKHQPDTAEKFMFVTGGNNFYADTHDLLGNKVKILEKPFLLCDLIRDCNDILAA